ncbi:MAG TPA: ATP-binding cassette domain-containing protein, partial [Candidatus Hydrogenedentes bacterium]|nr:ATP-binding cassette domain-containing protein [Candidatus Hydrogenedentota bacterium]
MAGAGLEVRNLAVGAAGGAILTGVNLTAAPGELVAVTGPSGCGKTTLLRTVAGLLDALSGTIHLDGHTPAAFGWPQYRRRVVLVDQQPVLLDRSVEENLKRPFSYQSANGGFPAARARTLLDRLGLEPDRWDQRARALSVGQQQRVCLVRALLLAPALVLLDEPTSALD